MTNIFDLFHENDYHAAVDAGLLRSREHYGGGLVINNYTDKAMYTAGAWDNPAVRHCRGLITDLDGIIVARPWSKFFNHGQAEAGELDLSAPVEVTDKLDGSLGIIYPFGARHRVATRGSFVSEQAIHATKVLHDWHESVMIPDWLTPLVEIIYPENRIVCDYGPLDDLILLGGVHNDSGAYYSPETIAGLINWQGSVAETFAYQTLSEALAAPPRPGAEGLCVRFLDEDRIVKIKQEDYVRLHRIVTGLSERSVWQHMMDGRSMTDLLDGLPDELHAWTTEVWQDLWGRAFDLMQDTWRARDEIQDELGEGYSRKEFAELAKRQGQLTPWLFAMEDGRGILPLILKTLKPRGESRAIARTEDVA